MTFQTIFNDYVSHENPVFHRTVKRIDLLHNIWQNDQNPSMSIKLLRLLIHETAGVSNRESKPLDSDETVCNYIKFQWRKAESQSP